MTRTASRPRAARRIVTVVASAMVALAAVSAAAPAFADGSYDDGGPGSATGGTAGGGPSDGTNYKCGHHIGKIPGALYHRVNGKWVMEQTVQYPNCDLKLGNPGFKIAGRVQVCPVGFEVYRFYGTANKAPTAVTRSRLNLPGWCEKETTYTFAGQTAWDANPAVAPGSPDYIKAPDSTDQKVNGLPMAVGRRETGNLTSGAPVKLAGSCTTVSSTNPLKQWLATASAADQVAYRIAIGNAYAKMAFRGGKTYPRTGALELGLKSVNGYMYSTPNANPKKAPTPDAKGTKFYASSYKFDERACASPFNFASVTDASTGKQVTPSRSIGTCYIPLMRQARLMKLPSGATKWTFQTIAGGGGERYSKFYRTNKDTGSAAPTWRAAMKADYLKRSTVDIADSMGRQRYPGTHYLSDDDARLIGEPQTSSSRTVAAAELAAFAKCRPGTTVSLSVPKTTSDPQAATLSLVPTNPKVLAAGGKAYRAEFRVSGGQSRLLCKDGKPCGTRAILKSLSYSMTLAGTKGYTKCANGQVSGCDFKIISATPGSATRDGVIVAEFYNGTSPGESVTLKLSNLRATYAYTQSSSGLTINGYDPVTGGAYQVTTGTVTTTFTKPVTPTVLGRPAAASYTTSWPVISAVSVPGRG